MTERERVPGGTLPHRCCMIGRRGDRLVQAAGVTTRRSRGKFVGSDLIQIQFASSPARGEIGRFLQDGSWIYAYLSCSSNAVAS